MIFVLAASILLLSSSKNPDAMSHRLVYLFFLAYVFAPDATQMHFGLGNVRK